VVRTARRLAIHLARLNLARATSPIADQPGLIAA
jgi:hypothetical protein